MWNQLEAPALCQLDSPAIMSQEFTPRYIERPYHLLVEHTALLKASMLPIRTLSANRTGSRIQCPKGFPRHM